MSIGAHVSTWGFPGGYSGASPMLSVGYLAAKDARRTAGGNTIEQWVVNAAFNSGNSGGPLLLIETGEVIGVVSSKLAPISQVAASALTALENAQSGLTYTATRPDGSTFTLMEGQIVAMVLTELRRQVQLVIGYAVLLDDIKAFLNANNINPSEGIPGNLIVNPASATGSFSPSPVVNGFVKEGILRGSRRLGRRSDQTYGFSDQQRIRVGVGWRLSLSAFGDLKTAGAVHEQARIEAERQLDRAKAQVVTAAQAGQANNDLIELAQHQVIAAQEALRLSEANLRAGIITTLDVLQAQDAVTQARLRHAEAVVRYNQSQVNLLAAIGLLDEPSLVPPPPGD